VSRDFHRNPFLLALYRQYLKDRDSDTFARRTAECYSQGTLQRLVEHDGRLVRRAAVLALGLLGDYEANATLGRALQDEDRTVRMLAEGAIRNVWTRVGTEDQQEQLQTILRLNLAKHFQEVIRRASELLKVVPWFAEVWNQRAIAHFALGHYREAIHDCHQALEINAYHFAAAAGMGQAYLQMGDRASALESFRRALRLNPDLEAVRVQIARLTRQIEGR
jgi:tetratricopeptide (TPR) repeat protein